MIQDKTVIASFAHRTFQNYGRRRVDIDWAGILSDGEMFAAKSKALLRSDKPMEAASMALQWLYCFGEMFDEEAFVYDDEGYNTSCTCKDCCTVVEDAMRHKYTTDDFRHEAVDMANKIAGQSTWDDYCFIDEKSFAKRVAMCIQSPEEELQSLDEQIIKERNNSRYTNQVTQLALRRYELLMQLGKDDEAESKILEDISYREVCHYRVGKYIEAKDYINALKTLDLAIACLPKEWSDYDREQYLKEKLDIYKTIGNDKSILDTYRQLFIVSNGNLNYYHALKALVPKDDWKDYLHKLMEEANTDNTFAFDKNNKAEILIEEGELKALADYLCEVAFFQMREAYAKYAKYVPQEYIEPVKAHYEECVAHLEDLHKSKRRGR